MLKSEIFLISLAIFCQSFSYIDSHYITATFSALSPSSLNLVVDAFLFGWVIIASVGKITGAYFFGKCADKFCFFAVMRLMTAFSLCSAILMLIIVIFGKDFYVFYKCLYIVKLLSGFLIYATIILPAMYLFDRYSSSKRILIGAYIMLAYFFSRFVSYAIAYYNPVIDTKFFSFIAIALSCIPFFIYAYLKKLPSAGRKIELTKKYS